MTNDSEKTMSFGRRILRGRRLKYNPWRESRPRQVALLESAMRKAVSELMEARAMHVKDNQAVSQYRQQAMLAQADLENYRKRANREKEDLRKFALQDFVEKLLLPLDSFDHALKAINSTTDVASLAQGVEAIYKQLESTLRSIGVERVEAEGKPFDPNVHEALMAEKKADMENNMVIDVLQNGYTLNGRLVRPARVRIVKND
jgi:molecular chaperone GrpE